ncbi:tyrosine-type recombinase/integrase [Bacillus atrophaeus]|uniref:tyrosine-type recombinase/integrase n=1 Tax=Bacillus atrophaeus TaxID=1452 RepID=UPI0040410F0A
MARFEKYETKKGERHMFIIENGVDPQTGKRQRVVRRGFKKLSDAKKAALDLEYTLGKAKLDLKNNILFKDMADEWLTVYSSTDKKISTIRVRRHEIGLLNQYFGFCKLKDITKKMYQDALTDMKVDKQLSQNTISGIHGTARMIFKRARAQDLIFVDPTEFAYLPKDKKTVEEIENEKIEDKYLEKTELKHFLHTALNSNYESYAMLHTLAWTGLRAGELAALKWTDIDFEEKTIKITKTYYNGNNVTKDYQLLPPKTKGSIRIIDVEDEVLRVLKKHKVNQNKVKMQIKHEWYDENFVFGRLNGPYWGYPPFIKTIENRFRNVLKKSNIDKKLTPHTLRHTHTSLLAEAGVDLQRIMNRLGHTEDKTTTQVYLHITKDRKKEASHKFGELMRSLENL